MRSRNLEVTGKTVEEAVEQALRQLGVPRSEVEIVVLKEGRIGFLGFGAEDAVVRVSLRQEERPRARRAPTVPPAPRVARPTMPVPAPETPEVDETVEAAQIVLEDLVDRMHLHAAVRQLPPADRGSDSSDDDRAPQGALEIRGEEMGLLIGRRGETLAALQLIVNMILSRRLKRRAAVTVDVEGYRRRREEDLHRMAQRIAAQVKSSGQPFTLEPMQPGERRIVHMALADDPRVRTESTGEGDQRRVVIMLKPGA
jgi:spoIIIJ-associated protein